MVLMTLIEALVVLAVSLLTTFVGLSSLLFFYHFITSSPHSSPRSSHNNEQNNNSNSHQQQRRRALFVHLDLGIGGAERLVVDAGLALKNKGYEVIFFTSHHDPNHCFPETKPASDGQPAKLSVRVHGAFLPHLIANSFQVACAIVRMSYCSIATAAFARRHGAHVIFCDGVSACIPILKLAGLPILFYCHFPDKELAKHQVGPLSKTNRFNIRRLYRYPFDLLEEVTTGMANLILVNSQFTRSIFKQSFPSLRIVPQLLYPIATAVDPFDPKNVSLTSPIDKDTTSRRPIVLLSINRFDPKKNLPLAVDGFAKMRQLLSSSNGANAQLTQLVMAGGYDSKVPENVQCFRDVYNRAKSYDLKCCVFNRKLVEPSLVDDVNKTEQNREDNVWDTTADVIFLPSISQSQKNELVWRCRALIYTPSNEHFGIVPVEAMSSGKPVIACRSGGPIESVGDDESCGYLCRDENIKESACKPGETAEEFGLAMKKLVVDEQLAQRMGNNGIRRVEQFFSRLAFENNLYEQTEALIRQA